MSFHGNDKDSDGYPTWLPRRPPPPGPQSTIQSSVGGNSPDDDSKDSDFFTTVGGRKPTQRSVRIVNLQQPLDETTPNAPPKVKVWSRISGPGPTFASSDYSSLPLPQPRFNTKYLNIQLLRSPSTWMKVYFYLWPMLIFYHVPLQTFFDFNAVYILLQVTKFPSPNSQSRTWALGATAYIACWLVWFFVVLLTFEIIYSFARRWRLQRPLILPIYLSSPAFNLAALTSFNTFSFLQYIRISALSSNLAHAIASFPSQGHSHSQSVPHDEEDQEPESASYLLSTASLSQFLAESCYFYSQNLPSVGLLLPRAGLCLALLFSFSTTVLEPTTTVRQRDSTFFNSNDGTLTDYAKGVLIANAAWTAWRTLVLLFSWLGLWLFSSNRLGGLSGPRHIWEEQSQEKTRSVYSSAASEHGVRNSVLYQTGGNRSSGYEAYLQDGNRVQTLYNGGYAGDELPWEWRERTRMRVQDAFEFCLTSGRSRSRGDHLAWGSYPQKRRSEKGKEKEDEEAGTKGGFEGVEKVLAAIGFGGGGMPSSPSRRAALTRDLFDTPEPDESSVRGLGVEEGNPERVKQGLTDEAGPSTMLPLRAPKVAKRNSKDKETIQHDLSLLIPPLPMTLPPPISNSIASSSTTAPNVAQNTTALALGAPLLSLPYPFSQPVVGRVSSKDKWLVPFPAGDNGPGGLAAKPSHEGGSSLSGSGRSDSESGSGSGITESGTGTGDDDDDDDDEDEDEYDEESEIPMSNRGSESMSSLGQPISPSRGYPLVGAAAVHMRRGHARNPSGVSSGMSSGGPRTQGRRSTSSGATGVTGTGTGSFSGGGYANSAAYSIASSGLSGLMSQDAGTGSERSTSTSSRSGGSSEESEQERVSGSIQALQTGGIPMPPRHPNQKRTRKVAISAPSSSSKDSSSDSSRSATGSPVRLSVPLVLRGAADAGVGGVAMHSAGSGRDDRRRRAESGPIVGGGIGSDVEGRYEDHAGFEGYEWTGAEIDEDDGDGEEQERDDRVGLLGVPSPRLSTVSVGNVGNTNGGGGGGGNGNGGRSRTHSLHSIISSSSSGARSKSKVGSRSRTHSANSRSSVSVKERVGEVGQSMVRSIVGAAAGFGLGASRSRVNSLAMVKLEEEYGMGGAGAGSRVTFGEGYASTSSHSRSGSESVTGENYTFGRPLAFVRQGGPGKLDEEVGGGDVEEDGDVLVSRKAVSVEEDEDDIDVEEKIQSGQ